MVGPNQRQVVQSDPTGALKRGSQDVDRASGQPSPQFHPPRLVDGRFLGAVVVVQHEAVIRSVPSHQLAGLLDKALVRGVAGAASPQRRGDAAPVPDVIEETALVIVGGKGVIHHGRQSVRDDPHRLLL